MRPRVLLFIDWFLPGTKSGGPVRSCANLIDHLGDEFEFLVVTRDTDYCETEPYKNVHSNAWNRLGTNASVFYISKDNLNRTFLKELIASTDFDVAYINGIYSRIFSILPVYLLKNSDKPILVAARGMLNPQAFSVKPVKKKIFLLIMNLAKLYKNVIFHATNQEEAEFIREAVGEFQNIRIASNLPRKLEDVAFRKRKIAGETRLISVARVAREKGTLTTLKAFSETNTKKEVVYDIYGPIYDQEYWKECREVIKQLPENIKVNYKGSVAGTEVPELLESYHFFIMPSEGENFGHGILEALTAGCPVLISDKTPWKNLKAKEIGWDCSLGSPELISAIEEAVAMDQETYERWSKNAFNFAKEYCNDPKAIEASRKLFA